MKHEAYLGGDQQGQCTKLMAADMWKSQYLLGGEIETIDNRFIRKYQRRRDLVKQFSQQVLSKQMQQKAMVLDMLITRRMELQPFQRWTRASRCPNGWKHY